MEIVPSSIWTVGTPSAPTIGPSLRPKSSSLCIYSLASPEGRGTYGACLSEDPCANGQTTAARRRTASGSEFSSPSGHAQDPEPSRQAWTNHQNEDRGECCAVPMGSAQRNDYRER